MNRRTFLQHAGLGAAALLAGPGTAAWPRAARAAGRAGEAPPRPNVVLILSDDMGYSDIGCYGGEIATPTLDALAARGVRFTQFYNTARCCPTRASLLTGLYPHQAAIGHMMGNRHLPGYQGDLSRNAVTIAEVMKSAGYGTYMAGKWHVTPYRGLKTPKHNFPCQRGFDHFFGTIHGAGSFYDPSSLTRDNDFIPPGKDFYYTDAIADSAARYIRDHRRQKPETPFFLYVAFTAAHWPMHAREEDIAKYKGRYDAGWQAVRRQRYARMRRMGLLEEEWDLSPDDAPPWESVSEEDRRWHARRMEVYAAMIDCMDRGIGRIVQALKETGAYENTLILFLQDNGGCAEEFGSTGPVRPKPGERPKGQPLGPDEPQTRMVPRFTRDGRPVRMGHGVMPGPADTFVAYGRQWANVSNTPFRLYKHYVHEGGIATPLIAHWPAGIPKERHGVLEPQPGHLIDIMATCVDVAGATYPKTFAGHDITPMEGVSLVPAMHGRPLGRTKPLFFEHEGNRAIRQGRWKLVARGPAGPWELYDMQADRSECHDLAAKHPDRVKEMAAAWEDYARKAHAIPWPWKGKYAAPKPERAERGKKT